MSLAQLGDIICGMNNRPIKGPADLFRELARHRAGKVVELNLLRAPEGPDEKGEVNFERVDLKVRLGPPRE